MALCGLDPLEELTRPPQMTRWVPQKVVKAQQEPKSVDLNRNIRIGAFNNNIMSIIYEIFRFFVLYIFTSGDLRSTTE